jgi:hypothetical protein
MAILFIDRKFFFGGVVMNKKLWLLILPFAMHSAFAQSPSAGDPSAKRSRAEVKAEERATGALGTKNTEVPVNPSTKGTGTSRSDVKAEVRQSGADVRSNTEAPANPSTKGSGKMRSEVKAEERATGSLAKGNIETPDDPAAKATGKTRAKSRTSMPSDK